MNISCEYGRYDQNGKIECTKLACPCGHVYLCQMDGKWKQTRQSETCPVRFRTEEPEKPKRKTRAKK